MFNWVDYVILAVAIYYILQGWETGLPHLLASLGAFLGSLWLAVKYHTPVGNFLGEKFGLPMLWTTVLGYLIVAMVSETIISEILARLVARLPKKANSSVASKAAGAAVSVINGLVIVAFILLVILALPLRGNVKGDIKASVLAKHLVLFAERYGGSVKSSLDEVTQQVQRFLTVEPNSKDRVALDVAPAARELSIDGASEEKMIALVNGERAKAGVGVLRLDTSMRKVARDHSRDMFQRRYFSHYDPEGHDAAWRMEQAGVAFSVVGENLAYAPDVDTAHQGLMNSEGHRHNILDGQFHRIGIGVIDGGSSGKMFTQVFAD
ncbi:CvpA family protein [Candidatus Gottesmanbacteria bacterium]|nr:CvpA family protein [Candidatus Gottesmanbacteria bacterium]